MDAAVRRYYEASGGVIRTMEECGLSPNNVVRRLVKFIGEPSQGEIFKGEKSIGITFKALKDRASRAKLYDVKFRFVAKSGRYEITDFSEVSKETVPNGEEVVIRDQTRRAGPSRRIPVSQSLMRDIDGILGAPKGLVKTSDFAALVNRMLKAAKEGGAMIVAPSTGSHVTVHIEGQMSITFWKPHGCDCVHLSTGGIGNALEAFKRIARVKGSLASSPPSSE